MISRTFTINEFIGKTLEDISVHYNESIYYDNDSIIPCIVFKFTDNTKYIMGHRQDCCEEIYIKEISGNLAALIGSPLVEAECVSNEEEYPEHSICQEWTFYKFSTTSATVNISWSGESNCYYSTDVSIIEITEENIIQ